MYHGIKMGCFINAVKHYRKTQHLFLMKQIPRRSPAPPVSILMGKLTPHFFFPPSFPSSPPLPSSPIKKRELRGHNGGKAGLFDPHAVLSSVFSIQPVWTGISGVDRPSAQRDKSPPANCCHIKWRGTSQIGALRLMERGRGKKKDSKLFLKLPTGFTQITPQSLLNISRWSLVIC